MKSWLRGQNYQSGGRRHVFEPVIEAADPVNKLLSFYNLAEAHILRATREREVSLKNVRSALHYIRGNMPPTRHPLLTHEFLTSGKDVFIDHLGTIINATAQGQVAMREILEKYLKRIDRDDLDMPIQIYPVYSKHLAINASLSSGKPVLKGTGIMVAVLSQRKDAGETIPELAKDYGLNPQEVEEAIEEYAAA
jgi:uncharacterized protein (DUF433 family)